jgi:hypothetical protein
MLIMSRSNHYARLGELQLNAIDDVLHRIGPPWYIHSRSHVF